MYAYFANVLSMLGIAIIATAIFRTVWLPGFIFGTLIVFLGALCQFAHNYKGGK